MATIPDRVHVGETFAASAGPITSGLVGILGVLVQTVAGEVVLERTTAGIQEEPEGSGVYNKEDFLAGEDWTPGMYQRVWDTGGAPPIAVEDFEVLAASSGDAFATVADIVARMGRDLTAGEETQAQQLLELASDAIAAACDRDVAWANALDPVPTVLRSVAIEATVRVLNNPRGVRSQSEQLAAHSHAESFADSTAGLELTENEELRVRRAVFGSNSGSSRPESVVDEIFDIRYGTSDE